MTQETLREAVARIIDPTAFELLAELNRTIGLVDEDGNEFPADERAKATAMANECIAKARAKADAAIATMFERLRDLPPSIYDGPDQYVRKADVLAAFQQENSDA